MGLLLENAQAFRRPGAARFTPPKLTIAVLFLLLPLWVLVHTMMYRSEVVWQAAAVAMGCGSVALFFWAYRQHGRQMPGRIFSPDVPAALITSGPYARLRHPIYAAYLLYLLGLVIGTQSMVAALLWMTLAATYRRAAKQEDELLANSVHGGVYRSYMRQSGRLLPWNVWRKREV